MGGAIIFQVAATVQIYQQKNRIEPMDTETTVERYSRYLQDINVGVMASLQPDPEDSSGDCNTVTGETNLLIDDMFKSNTYSKARLLSQNSSKNILDYGLLVDGSVRALRSHRALDRAG